MEDKKKLICVTGFSDFESESFACRFVYGKPLPEDYSPVMQESYRTQVESEGKPVIVDFCFVSADYDLAYSKFDGFVVMFDLKSAESFQKVKGWVEGILRQREGMFTPLVIVGTNCHLEEERAVPFEDAQELADSFGCSYFDISLRTGKNVNECINELIPLMVHGNSNVEGVEENKKKHNCTIM